MTGAHRLVVVDRDENENRVRTKERCERCGYERYGCFAKRILSVEEARASVVAYDTREDAEDMRAAWGLPGVWSYSRATPWSVPLFARRCA